MEQFRLRKDGFKEIRKGLLIKVIPLSLLAAGGGLAISHFNTTDLPTDINSLFFVVPIVLCVLTFGIYRGINRQKEIFESYSLTVDENGITREQHNTPSITISNSELSEIIKNSNGSFTIRGGSSINVIGVPSQIDDYEKLEKLLSEKRQISTKTHEPFLQKNSRLLSLLTIGLLAAVAISKDKLVVSISGTVLIVFLGYSFIEVQRSKNVDRRTKKEMWWIILVAGSIAGVMYYKLSGQV